jgi:hypothetical protein
MAAVSIVGCAGSVATVRTSLRMAGGFVLRRPGLKQGAPNLGDGRGLGDEPGSEIGPAGEGAEFVHLGDIGERRLALIRPDHVRVDHLGGRLWRPFGGVIGLCHHRRRSGRCWSGTVSLSSGRRGLNLRKHSPASNMARAAIAWRP